jgi:membrane protease YdiL (CAAX protease family)
MMQHNMRPVFRVSVVAIMIFQIAALLARVTVEQALVEDGFQKTVAGNLAFLVVPAVLLLLMYPYLKRGRRVLLDLLRPADLTARVVVLSILLGLILRITYWSFLTLLLWIGVIRASGPDYLIEPVLDFECPPLPVLFLSIGVMAVLVPLIEEIIYRAFILHALLPRGTIMAVLVSAALFAVLHRSSGYLVAFCGGIFFAVQMLNSRTLWAPLIAHGTFNCAMVFDWQCLRVLWNPALPGPKADLIGWLSLTVAVSSGLLACYLVSRQAVGARNVPRHG